MGARIEISYSHANYDFDDVAPLVGARIEIARLALYYRPKRVAPLVGARIEMRVPFGNLICARSLPSWERGLKFVYI